MNILNVCVKVVTLNKPPNILIPLPRGFTNKLFKAKKLTENNPMITIREKPIDFSRNKLTAFESNRKINKVINMYMYKRIKLYTV